MNHGDAVFRCVTAGLLPEAVIIVGVTGDNDRSVERHL
jgi:hypothetical protein